MTLKLNTTMEEYEAGGGDAKFIGTITSALGIQPQQMEVTDKWRGSVFLKFKVQSDGGISLQQLRQQLEELLKTDIGYPIVGD